jgi:signal transduction histidine kinase
MKKNGKPYNTRGLRPKRRAGLPSAKNGTLGAVLPLADIHTSIHSDGMLEEQRQYSKAIIGILRESILVLDIKFRVVTANNSFYKTFKVTAPQTIGTLIYDLGNGQWNILQLRKLLRDVLARDAEFWDFEVDHMFPAIGRRKVLLNARRFTGQSSRTPLVLLAIQDETLRDRAQRMSARLLRVHDDERRRFARELHDSTVQSLSGLMINMNRLASIVPDVDSDVRSLLADCKHLAESSMREIRSVSYLLHPPALEEVGLEPTISSFASGFSKRSGIRVDLISAAICRVCQKIRNLPCFALFRRASPTSTAIPAAARPAFNSPQLLVV